MAKQRASEKKADQSANLGFEAKLWLAATSFAHASVTLSALRDTLCPKLLSGQLPVPAALTATEETVQP